MCKLNPLQSRDAEGIIRENSINVRASHLRCLSVQPTPGKYKDLHGKTPGFLKKKKDI